jgi:hypothetical protein
MLTTGRRCALKLRPHRLLPAGELPGLHALHEQMASNCQLATDACPSGLLASGARLKRFAAERQLQPGQALAMHHLHTDALLGEGPAAAGRPSDEVSRSCTMALLQGGAPVPESEWLVSDCGRFARRARLRGVPLLCVVMAAWMGSLMRGLPLLTWLPELAADMGFRM